MAPLFVSQPHSQNISIHSPEFAGKTWGKIILPHQESPGDHGAVW